MNIEERNSIKKNSVHDHQDTNLSVNSNMNEEELKLMNAKKDRLKMEQAANILENRVLYLEKINGKMNKKIESAKNRAVEIMKLKKQNLETEQMKQTHIELKETHLKEKQQKIQEMKNVQEERLNSSKMNSISNSIVIAKNTKESLLV